jgi:capsular exopolysaccharide synthesis family protein
VRVPEAMSERGSEPQGAELEPQSEDLPRYAGDYLRVLRRHKVLIALITVGFLGAAFLYSSSRPDVYEAEAQISFRDVLADVDLLELGDSTPEPSPTQQAILEADLIARPEVRREARRRLDPDLALDAIGASVSARVGTQTNLVIIRGEAEDPQVAADLANAYARAARTIGREEEVARLDEVGEAITREIDAVAGDEPTTERPRLAELERLRSGIQALSQVTEPVQVVSRAEAPAGPSSPRTRRDVALGGLIGLAVGLLAAFGRANLDRRVRTAEDLQDELGAPVLTRVDESALGYAGLASNGVAPMPGAEFERFRVLRANLAALRSDRSPRSVLVTSAVPDEGKSTVSMALASAAAIAGQDVLLVECDLRRPAFEQRLGVSREPGLTDYLLGEADPREILSTVELSYPATVDGPGGHQPSGPAGTLVCVAAGKPVPNPAELLVSDRFRGLLAQVSEAYDLVVIDSSPLLTVVDPLELVAEVDAAIVCVRAQRTTMDQLRDVRAALGNLPPRPVGAVLTGLPRSGPDSYGHYHGYGYRG